MNKELILRERLAIERTHLTNQTTLLAFVRTGLYFFVAGLSITKLVPFKNALLIDGIFFSISVIILIIGLICFFKNRKWIRQQAIHIGDYKLEYEKDTRY